MPLLAPVPRRLAGRTTLPIVFALFFVSGFSALLYQVVWQRVLAVFSGADLYSVTIIVAAYMAGLGCGSVAGGYVADRVGAATRVLLFAIAELAVALFAVVSLWLYYDVLYVRYGHLAASPRVLAVVLFAGLLWPTFFMGTSLPLLAKAVTRRVEGAAGRVGALYGFNTLGAALGAFCTTWVLSRMLGFENAVRVGAALNAAVALGALALWPRLRGADEVPNAIALDPPPAAGDPDPAHVLPVPAWVAVYGVAGFVALSLEIVWFRLLGVLLKSTAFSFGTLLGVFLTGHGAGTLAGAAWARRSTRPALVFLALQAAVAAYAGLMILALRAGLDGMTFLAPLRTYVGGYEPVDLGDAALGIIQYVRGAEPSAYRVNAAKQLVMLYLVVPVVIIGPPTFLMGASFPFLQKVVQTDVALLGRRVGWLQAANIFGSMLGAILTGGVLLRVLGTASTEKLLVLCAAFFLLLMIHAERGAGRALVRAVGVVGVAAVLTVAWLVPDNDALWAALHGTTPDRVIAAEDGSGLSMLKASEAGFRGETVVYANGLGQSSVPFPEHHIALGLVPAMLHPNPRAIAVVGLGSGATLFAAGGRPETTRITSIEIVAPQFRTLSELHRRTGYGGLASLLDDRRITYTFADARAAIRLGGDRYDIIEADALRSTSAYAGNLYSVEYFTLLRHHLADGGYAVTWVAANRVIDTFAQVFPYTMLYEHGGLAILVGSDRPIPWDAAAVSARLRGAFSTAYYARAGVALEPFFQGFASARPTTFSPARPRPVADDPNTDLYPRDEFLVPRPGQLAQALQR
jgi:predicted membrane-bound spermidine synthase